MKKLLIFIVLILLSIGYLVYDVKIKQDVIHALALEAEAERLEADDKKLSSIDIQNSYKEAIEALKKPLNEHTRIESVMLRYNLGTIYGTRHQEELDNLYPTTSQDAYKLLKEIERKFRVTYGAKK